MEILPEGKNFRLAQQEELPEILALLEKHLPDAIKVGYSTTILTSARPISAVSVSIKMRPQLGIGFENNTEARDQFCTETINIFQP